MKPLAEVSNRYGAPMGRGDTMPGDTDAAIALEIERLVWVDGDYDQGGAYWGNSGDYIWRFTGDDGEQQVEVFIRSKTEGEAVAQLHEKLPGAVIPCDGLEDFFAAYVKCALWSSSGPSEGEGSCEMLDELFNESDIAPETIAAMREDCSEFLSQNRSLLEERYSQAGHDFWLTRNHHGAGFWDGDWPEHGDELTDRAQEFGECDLYPGDDGRIYAM